MSFCQYWLLAWWSSLPKGWLSPPPPMWSWHWLKYTQLIWSHQTQHHLSWLIYRPAHSYSVKISDFLDGFLKVWKLGCSAVEWGGRKNCGQMWSTYVAQQLSAVWCDLGAMLCRVTKQIWKAKNLRKWPSLAGKCIDHNLRKINWSPPFILDTIQLFAV